MNVAFANGYGFEEASQQGADAPRSPWEAWLPWVAMAVVGGAFFLCEHDFDTSLKDAFTQTAEEMQETATGGNLVRRLAYPCVGLFGLVLLALPSSRPIRIDPLLVLPMVAYVLWCGASVVWSISPGMTIRRLIVFHCIVLAAVGLAKHLRTRDLLLIGVVVPLVFLTIGLLVELRFGTFRPWASEHRFSGTLHPNTQGINLACLCLSSACLLQNARRWRVVLVGLFLSGFLFLLLTKSRTSAAGVLVALAAFWTVTTPLRTKLLLGFAGTWFVSSLVLGVLIAGIDVGDKVAGAALMGREEQAESLTGRLPIWTTLTPFVLARPIAGYGFESFWTPEHIAEVSSELHWGIREAHSTFFDTLLSVGGVGLCLALGSVLIAMIRCQQRYVVSHDPVNGLLLGLIVFGLINACTESAMMMHGFYTFVAGTGLWLMALRPAGERGASAPCSVESTGLPAITDQPGRGTDLEAPGEQGAHAPRSPGARPTTLNPQPTHTML